MALTADEILKGAYFAMEQAGRLLDDGCALYQDRRWASSLMLAVCSLEEMGKAETLLTRARKAKARGPMRKRQVRHELDKHTLKLRAASGTSSLAMRIFFRETELLTTSERVERDRRVVEAEKIALEEAPHADHEARMRALYVDLGSAGWLRPADTRTIDAFRMLNRAAIEYDIRRSKFLRPSDPFVAEAWKRMATGLPSLPETRHPAPSLALSGKIQL